MIPENCDICDQPVLDQDEVVEDDGIYRCVPCHQKYLKLRKQYPERF